MLNGSGGNNYSWSNSAVNGVSFVPSVGLTNYLVTGTDLNGCVNTDQIVITVYNLPAVAAGVNQVLCQGTMVTLNATGAVSYTWNNGVIDNVPFAQGVGFSNYTVIGTDANGCIASDVVQVTVNALPNVFAGGDEQICESSLTVLTGSGTDSYSWNNGVVNSVPFSPKVGSLSYIVTGIDINGCINTDEVQVLVFALPNVIAGIDQQVCDGESITLNAFGANSYVWSGGAVNNVSFVPSAGVYHYVVNGTDANLCSNSDTVLVIVNIKPIVNAGANQKKCTGEPVVLSATGSINLFWNNAVLNDTPFIKGWGL